MTTGVSVGASTCNTDVSSLQNIECDFPCFLDRGLKTCAGDPVSPHYVSSIENLICMSNTVLETWPESDLRGRVHPLRLLCSHQKIVQLYTLHVGIETARRETADILESQFATLEILRELYERQNQVLDAALQQDPSEKDEGQYQPIQP